MKGRVIYKAVLNLLFKDALSQDTIEQLDNVASRLCFRDVSKEFQEKFQEKCKVFLKADPFYMLFIIVRENEVEVQMTVEDWRELRNFEKRAIREVMALLSPPQDDVQIFV